MGELVGQIGVLPTTAGGILALFCILILTGQVPTRRELRDANEREKRALEREMKAMELANAWQQVASQHGMTLVRLIEYAEAADHALTAIQQVVERTAGEDR